MTKRWIGLCWVLTLAGASVAGAQAEHHVCRLLKAGEIETLLGPTVVLANVVEDEPERSTFSDLLPSQVLRGDVLLELNMALLKSPETKFLPLAKALLARI